MNLIELRIGNWVQVLRADDKYQIEAHHFNNDDLDALSDPIPLTKEWLLNFGFKRGEYPHSDSFYIIPVGGSDFCINPDNGVVWIIRNDNIFNNPASIEYVHSLQNIYFALTGNELTLKSNSPNFLI